MEDRAYEIDKDKVAWREIEGEITILDKKAGEFFHLNSTASRIWHLIQEGAAIDAITGDLKERFDGGDQSLHEDITGFMSELSGKGFIKQK